MIKILLLLSLVAVALGSEAFAPKIEESNAVPQSVASDLQIEANEQSADGKKIDKRSYGWSPWVGYGHGWPLYSGWGHGYGHGWGGHGYSGWSHGWYPSWPLYYGGWHGYSGWHKKW